MLLDNGFGFTDVVKRPTGRAGALRAADFAAGAVLLVEKLKCYRPSVACFHGTTAYGTFHRMLADASEARLGPQPSRIGDIRLYVVPNPSPANAHSSLADQTLWYDRLAAFPMTDQSD